MQSDDVNSFVLVHGAYHGGWCWAEVAKQLEQRGHRVFAPTLTGLSERRDSFAASVNLDTHVKDIVDFVLGHELTGVHLVGWSYGGMVITGVLGAIPERIAAMTYLDAHLPADKHSASSYLGGMERFLLKFAAAIGKGLPVPSPTGWGLEHDQAERVGRKLSKQPARTLTQAVSAPEPWPARIHYSYVRCSGYSGSIFDLFYAKAVRDPRFLTREIDCGHGAVHTHPTEVANAILDVCSESPRGVTGY